MPRRPDDPAFRMMSEAVQQWYRFYLASPDDKATETLCSAAIDLYNEGHRSADEIATMLIGTYFGIWSTRVNAHSSGTVH